MQKPSKLAQIPQIRFAGFTEDWERRKLGDCVDVQSGRDYKHLLEGNIPVYGTGGYMLSVNEALSYNQDAIGIGRKGTIDKPYILKAPFWTVDTLFYALPRENNKLDFLNCIFQKINWKSKDESTGVPSLSKTIINNVDIHIPEETEQTKIGSYFQSLDKLITLHQSKFEKLKKIKKSCLQNLFPQNNQNTPKIRFKNFTDEWVESRLGELGNILTGSTPPTNISELYDNNGIPWVTPTDITSNLISKTCKRLSKKGELVSRIVPPKTILVTCIASIGKNAMLLTRGSFNQQINSLTVNDNNDPYFMLTQSSLWSEQMKKQAAQATMQIVNKTEFSNIKAYIPNLTEQEKIGAFFSKLDKLITLQQRKVEKLKNIKKALLNKMFI